MTFESLGHSRIRRNWRIALVVAVWTLPTMACVETQGSGCGPLGGGASIQVSNDAPNLNFILPADQSTYVEGEIVEIVVMVKDRDDATGNLVVRLYSELDGQLHEDAASEEGYVEFAWTPVSIGTHVLTAIVFDPDGLSGEDSVSIDVEEAIPTPSPTASPTP